MKTYEKMAADVLKRRDEYEESRKQSESSLKTAVTVVLAGAFIVSAMIVGPIIGRLIKSPANQPSNTTDAVTPPAQTEEIKKDKELTFTFINSKEYNENTLKSMFGLVTDSKVDFKNRTVEEKGIEPIKYTFLGKEYIAEYSDSQFIGKHGFDAYKYKIVKDGTMDEDREPYILLTKDGQFYQIIALTLFNVDMSAVQSREDIVKALREDETMKILGVDGYTDASCSMMSENSYAVEFYNTSNGIPLSKSMEIRIKADGSVFGVKISPELNGEYNGQIYGNDDISVDNPDSALMKALNEKLEEMYNSDKTKLSSFKFDRIHFAQYEGKPAVYMWMTLYIDCTMNENEPFGENVPCPEEFMVLIDGLDPVK